MPTFSSRDDVINRLVSDDATAYERWAWERFLVALDAKGFRVVAKSTIDKGKPTKIPS